LKTFFRYWEPTLSLCVIILTFTVSRISSLGQVESKSIKNHQFWLMSYSLQINQRIQHSPDPLVAIVNINAELDKISSNSPDLKLKQTVKNLKSYLLQYQLDKFKIYSCEDYTKNDVSNVKPK
jgi:hypothetical protein